jgi:MFS transporter, Spinster family, sphingosine-1-phosphate transporter
MVFKYVLLPHVNRVSYKFGLVAMMAGLIGVPLGSGLAQHFRPINSSCDPLICAFGLITSAPFVYLGLVVAKYSTDWAFFFVFMAQITLNLCWSLVADMLLVR